MTWSFPTHFSPSLRFDLYVLFPCLRMELKARVSSLVSNSLGEVPSLAMVRTVPCAKWRNLKARGSCSAEHIVWHGCTCATWSFWHSHYCPWTLHCHMHRVSSHLTTTSKTDLRKSFSPLLQLLRVGVSAGSSSFLSSLGTIQLCRHRSLLHVIS